MGWDIRARDVDPAVYEDLTAIKEKWGLSWAELWAAVAVDPPREEVQLAALRADTGSEVLDEYCASEAARGEAEAGDERFGELEEFTPGE